MIKLTDELYIKADERSYTLTRRTIAQTGKNVGEANYTPIGYYTQLAGAIRGAYDYSVRQALSGDTTISLTEAISIINSIYLEFKILLNKAINGELQEIEEV